MGQFRLKYIIFVFCCSVLLNSVAYSRASSVLYTDTITTLVRGPYLQVGTPNSVIIRWRSADSTTSKISYGFLSTSLTTIVSDTNMVIDHKVLLSGLTPNTKYFYSIGSSIQTLQGDTANYFYTSPPVGTPAKTTIWATGDCGTNLAAQNSVRDSYINYMGYATTNVWLLIGDNAYNAGSDVQYQNGFFNHYKDKLLKQTVVWPAPGNHDYADNVALQNSHAVPYYSNFTMPSNAEVGGFPSNSASYYSFNYANIHFVSLDSYGIDSSLYRMSDTLGPQAVWLKQDLALNSQKWTIVYWHHPPYSMGSHNSDTEIELKRIRQNFNRIVERYNVDLVISGHSHDFERTKLIKGYYGLEATYDSSLYEVNSSTALYNGSVNSCPYIKNSGNLSGTVYCVSGSAGHLGIIQTSFPHAAMFYSDAVDPGSMVIDVEKNKLNAKWLCSDGIIRDQFTIMKDVNIIKDTTIVFGQSVTLYSSWIGFHSWSPSAAFTENITVSPDSSTTYTVTDTLGCLQDVFHVNVCYLPQIISQSTDTTLCKNSPVSFHVFAQGTDTILYQWQNSIDAGITWNNVVNDSTFLGSNSSVLQIDSASFNLNAIIFRCTISSSCGTIYSNAILLNVLPIVNPTVSISASPGTTLNIGDTVVYTAVITNGGLLPIFQWMMNGINVGLDSFQYSTNTLVDGDVITCQLISDEKCIDTAIVNSNSIVMTVLNTTSIESIGHNANYFQIKPNPSSGLFAIYSNDLISDLEILNVLGQRLYSSKEKFYRKEFDLTIFDKGIYFMKFRVGVKNVSEKIIIQ